MQEQLAVWEGVADAFHDETGLDDPPVDAVELVTAAGLRLEFGSDRCGTALHNRLIRIPTHVRPHRAHGLMAHELGHFALRRYGEEDGELAASYVAGALMLPRRRFDRDVASTKWQLDQLQRIHCNASAEMVGFRITQVRDAVVSVYDAGKFKRRIISPWIDDGRFRRVTSWEKGLVDECFATGEMVWGDDLVQAWPVFTPGFRRVVLIAEARQLALRW